jgi:hypothetical protein
MRTKLFMAILLTAMAAAVYRGAEPEAKRENERARSPATGTASARAVPLERRPAAASPLYQGRQDTERYSLSSFLAGSQRPWSVTKGDSGFVKKLAGGSFTFHGPAAGPAAFLKSYSQALLGVNPETLVQKERRTGPDSSQLIYEQTLNGLPVDGTRLNMMLGPSGDLIYITAAVYPGAAPAATPNINQAEAALLIREALQGYVERRGGSMAAGQYSVAALTASTYLSYRLHGDSISLIYKAEFELAAPLYGGAEAIVDAQTKTVVSLRALAKN